tara:strand:+ start:59 stop:163 length:105 start_codon:yes stop_codon:yes gene_type:complete
MSVAMVLVSVLLVMVERVEIEAVVTKMVREVLQV